LLAGWITTEAGRQPWVVYGYFRTAQAVSPVLPQSAGLSLLIFVMVYFLVFGTGIYYILKLINQGPPLPGAAEPLSPPVLAADVSGRRPLAAVK
jgi:cytochrome bd ubiquinol oxidase subunit I